MSRCGAEFKILLVLAFPGNREKKNVALLYKVLQQAEGHQGKGTLKVSFDGVLGYFWLFLRGAHCAKFKWINPKRVELNFLYVILPVNVPSMLCFEIAGIVRNCLPCVHARNLRILAAHYLVCKCVFHLFTVCVPKCGYFANQYSALLGYSHNSNKRNNKVENKKNNKSGLGIA